MVQHFFIVCYDKIDRVIFGKEIQEVKIHTPKGIVLNLELLDIRRSAEKVSCAVRKDGGDDPDVTDKALIYAEVTFGTEEGIVIDGGFGVGRVTKPGLDQPVGNAAINHVPRQMIRENVEEIQKKLDDFRALQVIISVPEGEELAKHTVQTIPLSAVITSEKHWNLQLSSALTPSFLWHILENLSRCPAEL